jgi:predicted nucleotidyltransferase
MAQDDKALLGRLNEHGVEFVIVGGVCGTLHGVSLVTKDIDVCCPFTRENLLRIERAMKGLNPIHRQTPNKLPLLLTEHLLSSLKNLYLGTDLGKIDFLSEIAGIGGYGAALARSLPISMSYGEFRMLNIDALIESKSAVSRDQDVMAVKQLRAIKERNERSKS